MKNKGLLIGLAILAIISAFILIGNFNKSTSTVSGNKRDFSIKDTAAVTKVFIADMFNNQVTLTRQSNDSWMVDNAYLANQNTINTLLETMNLITIKSPVSKSKYDMVVRYMAATGIKAEFYLNNQDVPEKVVFLGPSNQTHTGTYMMLENSNSPYLMHIEGFYGFLNPRFSPYTNEWRDKLIVRLTPKEIQKVQIAHSAQPQQNFMINRSAEGQVVVTDGTGIPIKNVDTLMAYDYLDRFNGVYFESWEENKTPMYIDSVRKSTPMQTLQITDVNNNITKIETFTKPLKAPVEIDGVMEKYDQDRMYAVINDNEFVVMQYFIFDPLNYELKMFKKQ